MSGRTTLLVITLFALFSFAALPAISKELPLERYTSEPVTAGGAGWGGAPFAATTGDFNEDGLPDLVVSTSLGSFGEIVFLPGHQPFAGKFERSFGSEVARLRVNTRPDFVEAGDFNADGHLDIVAASKDGSTLYLFPGAGGFAFGAAEAIEIKGRITALSSGDVNRRDGLADLIVAVMGVEGASILVFQDPAGALESKAESITTSAEITSLQVADLNEDTYRDIAAGASNEVVIIQGRDRKFHTKASKSTTDAPKVERLPSADLIRSVFVGDFSGDFRNEIALHHSGGSIQFLERDNGWKISETRNVNANDRLFAVRSGSGGKHRFFASDSQTGGMREPGRDRNSARGNGRNVRSMLSMRFNNDASADLVVVGDGGVEILFSAPVLTFVVNDAGDGSDNTPGDGVCDTDGTPDGTPCTLRAAIEEANASVGEDAIHFSIGSGAVTITPSTAYPAITEISTIDGTTQPGFAGVPIVELDGSVAVAPEGLLISADNSIVRGLVVNDFNHAIRIDAAGGGVVVEGNYLGTDLTGTQAEGGAGQGVYIQNSPNNTIGGTTAGNIIGAYGGDGIYIEGGSATGNVVQGNYLGVGANESGIGNGFAGVEIAAGASGNTIGGTTAGSRNVISGNATYGIALYPGAGSGNLIQGNFIGTNPSGGAALPNTGSGIFIGSNDNTVGGTTSAARNIISGNGLHGIETDNVSGNAIQGNYIGLDWAGTAILANGSNGIHLWQSSFNLIGGTAPGARNVISGNTNRGIEFAFSSNNNTIQGNYIGTNLTGAAARPNGQGGVLISQGSSGNLIGGEGAAARNVISGNSSSTGIRIADSDASGNVISGNYIGVNTAGTSALRNQIGIQIENAPSNTIGGETPDEGNLISKNQTIGVHIQGSSANNNQILNNTIGLFSNGNAAAQPTGILIENEANNNTIGDSGAGNRILAAPVGIDISGSGTNNNVVRANWIGWPAGTTPKGIGVRIRNDASGNQIGNADPDLGNRIENNGGAGVLIKGNATDFNSVRANQISNNGGLGIDLQGTTGVSLNDLSDGDNGPNDTMNFPVITGVFSDGESTTVQGQLDTPSPDTAVIDFYANTTLDPTGYGEGQEYLGSTTPDGSGNFFVTLDAIGDGTHVTATATDAGGNTSEFSSAVQTVVTLPTLSINNVSVTEGNSGTVDAIFTVTLSVVQQVPVSVQFDTQDDSASEGDDFNGAHDVLVIPAGSTSGTITVQVNGDQDDSEGDQTFLVILSNPTNASISDGEGVGTIVNDDGLPSFSINDVAVIETDSTATAYFKVTLSQQVGNDVSVSYSTADGSATAPGDYSSTAGVATIPANTSEVTVQIPIVGDNISEGDETFFVNLSNPSAGTVISDAQGFGIILNAPDLTATAQSESSVLLSWSDPNEDETGFRIDRSFDAFNFSPVGSVGPDTTTFTDTGLGEAQTAYYRIVPLIATGSAPPSNVALATTFTGFPTKICLTQVSDTHTWARYPSVAYDSNTGKYGMVYGERTGGQFDEIYFQLLNADGTKDGAPVQITETDMPGGFPSIGWNGTNFGIVYTEHIREPNTLSASTVNFALVGPTGTILRRGVRLESRTQGFLNSNLRNPIIWNGSSWGVFYNTSINGQNELAYLELDADGDILTGPVNISNNAGATDLGFSAFWNGSEYGVTWIRQTGSRDIFFQLVQPDGTLTGSAVNVHSTFESIQQTSVVANGSNWAVAWDETNSGNFFIYLMTLDGTGTPTNSPQQISDDVNPSIGFVDDEMPVLFNKPLGGYLIYAFSFECETLCSSYEITRLEADSSGNRVGTRSYLSTNDGANSIWHDVATDGAGNFVLAYNDHTNGTQEISDVAVDASGVVVSGGGPHNDITTGHWPGNAVFTGNAAVPYVIPFLGGFVTMWNDISIGPLNQIYAKIFDAGGNLASTHFPLSSRGLRRRPHAVANGGVFAVAWKDNNNEVIVERFDGNGNSQGETVVTTANGQPEVAIDTNGQEYGIAYVTDGNARLAFQRVATDGSLIGSEVTVATSNNGSLFFPGPQIQWIGSGWAILWGQDADLFFSKIDASGAVIIAPLQVTFTGSPENNFNMVWNGQVLGAIWTVDGETRFTVMTPDGVPMFAQVTVPDANTNVPDVYWDAIAGKFKVVHGRYTYSGIFETEIAADGTIGTRRMLSHREGSVSAASNGRTAGILSFRGNTEMLFQTTACSDDATPPSCPGNVNLNYDTTKVEITWDPADDSESGILKHFVYRDGAPLAELNAGTTSFNDYGFHNGTNSYEIRALNGAILMSVGCASQSVDVGAATTTVSIDDVTAQEGNSGTTNFNFTISLSAPVGQDVDVSFQTGNGSALVDSDYFEASGACTIFTGNTSCGMSVTVIGDAVLEDDETFVVNLLSATGGVTIGDSQGTGNIQNDEIAQGISINDVTVTEGNSGVTHGNFTVTLSYPVATETFIDFHTQDDSANCGDYGCTANTVSIPAGNTTTTISVEIYGDTDDNEGDETFFVYLDGTNGPPILDGEGVGTITNDDGFPGLSIQDVAVAEGDTGTTAYFTVTLANAVGNDVTVDYSTSNGTAESPADYAASSGTLTILAGNTTGTIAIPITGDNVSEGDETFYVNLTNPSFGATITDNQAFGVILESPDLYALATSQSSIALSWSDPNEEEIGFRIDRSGDGFNFNTIANVGANTSTYTDSPLCGSCTFYYRVTPQLGTGFAPSSNVSYATTFPDNAAKVCLNQASDTHTWARNPAAAFDSNTGKYGIVYSDRNGGNFDELYFRLLNADGTPAGAPVQISETDMPTNFPNIVFNGTNFGITYGDHMRYPNAPNAAITKFALVDGTGTILRREVIIVGSKNGFLNNNLRNPLVWNGDSWGLFLSQDFSGAQELAYYRLDEDGDILAGPINITNTGGQFDGHIHVAWNGSEYGMAWLRDSELLFQRMQADGTLLGSPTSIINNGNVIFQPNVIWNGSGWAVAWDEFVDPDNIWIYLQLLDASGTPSNTAQKISDEINPSVGFVDDELPILMNKPGGGYLIYAISFECLTFCTGYEVIRLEADSSGNKVGSFSYLSANDGLNSIYHHAATDGSGNFLLIFNDHTNGTQEIADVVVDASGTVVSNGGPHDLTAGHWPGNQILFGGASNPFTLPFQGGFVNLWSDISAGPVNQIYARIYDNSGAVSSTRFPLSTSSPRARPQAVANGGEFAVAWKDSTNKVVVGRFDGNGDPLGETELVAQANGRPLVAIDFNGQEYAVAYVTSENTRLAIHRMATDGSPIGNEITVTSLQSGFIDLNGPQILWIGSGWAVLWKQNGNLYYSRLDSSGAVISGPTQVTFSGGIANNFEMKWNGQVLGALFTQSGEVYLALLDVNGIQPFAAVVIPDSTGSTTPSLYWDQTSSKFKVVYARASQLGVFETEVDPNGTIGSTRMLAHREGSTSIAFDGKTAGLLWFRNNTEMLFQTTECLNDGTAPACPGNVSAIYDGTKVTISWDPSDDSESTIAKYFLLRDGLVIAELNPSTTSYIDYGFHQGTSYYEVRAMNGAYLVSSGCTPQAVVIGSPDTPSLSINDVSITEGNGGTSNLDFTITLSAPFNVDVDVDYVTFNGSALNGVDYLGVNGTCTIPAMELTCTVTVPVVGETTYEADETFSVQLSNAVNATIADAEGVGTIQNDDGVPALSINDVAIAEEDTLTYLVFTVQLSGVSDFDISVNYATTNGTASAPNDYITASGTLIIPAGASEGTFEIQIAGDNVAEGDETFFVNLSGATGDATIADSQGMGVILEAVDLTATAISSSSVLLNWTDPNENETGFRVQRSTNGTSFSNIGSVGANTTTFTDNGRAAATLYYYRIVPFTSTSNIAPSNVASVTTFPSTAAKVCLTQVSDTHTWARNPSAAWNGSQWGVVYQEKTVSQRDAIYFQLLNADGTTSGSPVQVSTGDAPMQFPTIRWNGTNFAVVWINRLRAPAGSSAEVSVIQFALLDSNGNILRTGVPVLSTSQVLFLASSLEIPVVWDGTHWGLFILESLNTPDEVVFYRLDSDGDVVAGPVNISNSSGIWDDVVSADWNGSEYGVAWLRRGINGGSDLLFQRMQTNGTLIGSPTLVTSASFIQSANLLWDGTDWVVVWDDISNSGIEEIVYLQKIDSSGALIGSPHRLTDDTDQDFGTYDEIPNVFTKPGGGYVVYTLSFQCDENFCEAYEVGRLEADSNGDRVGSRVLLSDADGKNSGYPTGIATDGAGNYLLIYPDGRLNTQEVATVVVDASGAIVAGGAIRDLTTGHSPGTGLLMQSGSNPVVIPFQSGFVTLWNDFVAGPFETRIFAKIFDENGNVTATKFPLSGTNLRNRPAAVAVGNTFAVAWKSGANGLRFARFDAGGNLIGSELQVSTQGGDRPIVALSFSGTEYGLAWIDGANLLFQRIDANGNLIGSNIVVRTTGAGFGPQGPQMHWTGSGWAILWPEGNEFHFARIDSSGAQIVSPRQVTFSGFAKNQFFHFAWNGQEFGLAWQEARAGDPPGQDLYFTVVDIYGNKLFEEIAAVATFSSDVSPNLYWAGDRFKLLHGRGDSTGIHELDLFTNGTIGGSKVVSYLPGVPSAASNGATVGMLWAYGRDEMYFQTTECLTDVTAPACPSASASYDGTKVTVSWSASSDAESGILRYYVYRDGAILAEQNASTTSYEDFGFVTGATHDYEVRAMNGAYLESTGCTVHPVTITGGSVPSGLTNNTAADVSGCVDSGVLVTWVQDPSDWADGGSGTRTYDVLRDGSPIATALAYGTTQFTDTTGSTGTAYTYTVRYNNGLGFSATTNPGAAASDNMGLSPSGVSNNGASDLNASLDTGVEITWNQDPSDWGDGGTGTRSYDVLRDGNPIASGLAYGTIQFTDTTGVNGTTYTYTVRYSNGCGLNTITSPGAMAADNVSAPSPTGLTNNSAVDLNACADTGVEVSWAQDPADWNDGGSGTRTYDVLRDGSPIVSGLAYGTTSQTDLTGVNGTTYLYTVRYNNGVGGSAVTSPGASAADNVATSETATQAIDPRTSVNGTNNSNLNPSFTIPALQASSGTLTWTLTGTTNLTNCVKIQLKTSSGVALTVKDFNQTDPGSFDVLSFYQTNGPGTGPYRIFLTEQPGCHSTSSTDNATISGTQMEVAPACL